MLWAISRPWTYFHNCRQTPWTFPVSFSRVPIIYDSSSRNLYKLDMYKQYARETFLAHEKFYHPIAAQMIRQDLEL